MHLRKTVLTALAAAFVWGAASSDAFASGRPRLTVGGHPYHNGNYFIPPSSAYEAPRVFPPARYGMPAYYVPNSYLPAGMLGAPGYGAPPGFGSPAYMGMPQHPYTWYPGIPQGKAGGYYLSAYGYYQTANW
jgi:hypothetical protein